MEYFNLTKYFILRYKTQRLVQIGVKGVLVYCSWSRCHENNIPRLVILVYKYLLLHAASTNDRTSARTVAKFSGCWAKTFTKIKLVLKIAVNVQHG